MTAYNTSTQYSGPTHVLVVDDHAIVRDGLSMLIQRLRAGSKVSHAANAMEVHHMLTAHADITLVVLDVHLPDVTPLQLLVQLRQRYPTLPVMMISADVDPTLAEQALARGAVGYLQKTADASLLQSAMEIVFRGGRYVPSFMVHRQRSSTGGELTARQYDVLTLLCRGLTNKEIARDLDVAEPTVKTHLISIFRILGVRSRSQAVLKGVKLIGASH